MTTGVYFLGRYVFKSYNIIGGSKKKLMSILNGWTLL